MVGYFKTFSTFRMLLLLVFTLSIGAYVYEARSLPGRTNSVKTEQSYETLLQCAETLGEYLSDIESITLTLAHRYELLENKMDANSVNTMLTQMLENSPPSVLGVAILLQGDDNSLERLAFVNRERMSATYNPHRRLAPKNRNRAPTPREVNLERTLTWTLLKEPPVSERERFQVSLGMSLIDDTHIRGEARLRAGMGWMRGIMAKMASTPGVFPLCITSNREFIWIDQGELHFDLDSLYTDPAYRRIVSSMESFLSGSADALPDNVIRADIMGTGWQLLATNITSETTSFSLPLTFLILSLAMLLGEAVLVSISPSAMGGARSPYPDVPGAPAQDGWLESAHNLLFKYRLSNPVQERINSELKVARDIQFSLVPDTFPPYSSWREFDLHSLLSPAREIGGDFYDFFMPDPDRVVIAVADVSGKGVPAALYMAVCRTAFRSLSRQADNPAELIRRLNDMLVTDNHSIRYVTIACFFIDLSTGKARYTIAGHPAPLWRRADGGTVTLVDQPRGTIVGMRTDLDFPAGEILLSPGDTLLLYTDGAPEARNSGGEDFDYNGLEKAFATAAEADTCRLLVENMDQAIRRHGGDCEQNDDITLLAFRYWGPGGRAASTAANPEEGTAPERQG